MDRPLHRESGDGHAWLRVTAFLLAMLHAASVPAHAQSSHGTVAADVGVLSPASDALEGSAIVRVSVRVPAEGWHAVVDVSHVRPATTFWISR